MTKSVAELEKMLQEQLGATWSVSGLSSVKAKKNYSLYEIYVLTLVLEAATQLGAHEIEFLVWNARTKKSSLTKNPDFKTGPHNIYTDKDVYAKFLLPKRRVPLEVHLGVYCQGKSGVGHECDICVIKESAANSCRTHKKQPHHTDLVLAIESKYYTQSIRVALSREFIGLGRDLTIPYKHNIVTVNPLIVPDGVSLLNRHNINHHQRLVPELTRNRTPEINALIDRFKNILHSY